MSSIENQSVASRVESLVITFKGLVDENCALKRERSELVADNESMRQKIRSAESSIGELIAQIESLASEL